MPSSSVWNSVRGHQSQIDLFRRSLRRKRLASAYLFVGPDGVGKRLFAHKLAQCLLCARIPDEDLEACGECSSCRQMMIDSHPDLLTAAPPEGKTVFPIEAVAGSKERRGREGLCYDISLRPMMAERRVAVIDDVQQMNAEAANAFLKTLEEPPAYATLFLITSNESALLPTIRSRCQPVRFAPLPPSEIASLLIETGKLEDEDEAAAVAALSEGSLTISLQLLDPELRELRSKLYTALARDNDNPLALSKQMIADGIEQMGTDTASQRQNAIWLVRFVIEFYRRTLQVLAEGSDSSSMVVPQVKQFASVWSADSARAWETLMGMLEHAIKAERQLARNNPPKMVLETLFETLSQIRRQMV
ncbi:DNA polymerase III subunit delta' [Thalassoroseus pseudoceratinae]|uniref:DNA polymerase III subunit delta' n=1 Tax=Thalassoroseus pseudoceratinae TaxID=2713176 RepID=UPI001420E6A2|nr:DNA polymerase III subunit delta' [Thalassoroseus pseudoceratinae]